MERYKSPTFCQMCDDHFSLFYLLIFRIYIIYKLSQSTALSLIAGKRRRIHVLYNLSINVRWKSDMRERATTVYWSWCKSLKLQLLVVPGPSPPPSPPSLSPACYWLKWQHWAGAAGRPIQSGVLDQLTIQVKFGKLSSLSSLLLPPGACSGGRAVGAGQVVGGGGGGGARLGCSHLHWGPDYTPNCVLGEMETFNWKSQQNWNELSSFN